MLIIMKYLCLAPLGCIYIQINKYGEKQNIVK